MLLSACNLVKFRWTKFDWKQEAGTHLLSPTTRILPPSDPLSHCISLVHILSYLDIDDVDECQLVSRRFRNVIQRNWQIIPHNIDIEMHNLIMEGHNLGVFIEIATYGGLASEGRSAERIMGVAVSLKDVSVCELASYHFRGFLSSYKEAIDNRETTTLEETLLLVLRPLFRRYNIWHCELSGSEDARLSPSLMMAVALLFKDCPSSCRQLSIPTDPELLPLIYHFWPECVMVDLSGIHGLLSELLLANTQLVVFIPQNKESETIDLIVEYIQGWMCGTIRVRDRFIIRQEYGRPGLNLKNIHRGILSWLSYGTVYFTTNSYFDEEEDFGFFLRSPIDNGILFIGYCGVIVIRHCIYFGDIKDVKLAKWSQITTNEEITEGDEAEVA